MDSIVFILLLRFVSKLLSLVSSLVNTVGSIDAGAAEGTGDTGTSTGCWADEKLTVAPNDWATPLKTPWIIGVQLTPNGEGVEDCLMAEPIAVGKVLRVVLRFVNFKIYF